MSVAERKDWIDARGFKLVIDPLKPGYSNDFDPTKEYQFMRPSWEEPAVFAMTDQHPLFNIAGLYYRPLTR